MFEVLIATIRQVGLNIREHASATYTVRAIDLFNAGALAVDD